MRSNLTPASARALDAAPLWARRLSSPDVQPLHLLLALLEEDEGRAAQLLTAHGVTPAAARAALAEVTEGTEPPSGSVAVPLGSVVQALLDHARLLAGEVSADRTIASEQLLLATLRLDEPLRRQLEALGLRFARLEGDVLGTQQPAPRLDEPLRLARPEEEIDTARILDAAANRAREALRVLEDYCRFVLDDTFLSGELKQLRHDLAETLAVLPATLLVEARETLHDVGTELSTERELSRHSLQAVVQANLKRLQEALRSLEEYGKLRGVVLGEQLERLRYRSYTLERALLLGAAARQRLAEVRLCVLVTAAQCTASLDWTVQEAAAGGAGMIQLREKQLSDRELLERARNVRRWTRQAGVLFILNDRPDLARLAEADGVHLGQDDLPVKEARRVVGPDLLIGVSTHNLDQLRQAVRDGASYVGVGPTFPSETKTFAELAGLEYVRQAVAETTLPAFVIGGVNLDTVGEAVAAGAQRVAVSQAVCAADDARAAAAALRRALEAS